MKLLVIFAVAITALSSASFANSDPSAPPAHDGIRIELWPVGKLVKLKKPETTQSEGRGKSPLYPDRVTRNVSVPTITIFLPKKSAKQIPAAIICPGGGYRELAIDKEGYDVARFLAKNGIAGIVLKYRLPHHEITGNGTPWPMLDVERAVRLVRLHAKEWRIDPNKIGTLGFSAGGHLAAWAAIEPMAESKTSTDPIKHVNARVDFAGLIYPVISMENGGGSQRALLGNKPDAKTQAEYSVEKYVTKQTPPLFIVCAADDPAVNPKTNSLALKKACDAAGVSCELHEFKHGGHGFGMGVRGGKVAQWPALFVKWLKSETAKKS